MRVTPLALLLRLALLGVAPLVFAACDKGGVDEAVEEIKDEAEDAKEEIEDEVDDHT